MRRLAAVLSAALALLPAVAGCSESKEVASRPRDGAGAADTTLRQMAAELLPGVEEASGLEARRPLALARTDRERLEAFLTGQLDEELPPDEARRVVAAYSRFGLLEAGLDLRQLLRSVYLEQVVGYYDPATDTLFVRDGVPSGQLRPVLVHEMVHALQDQYMDLDSVLRARREENDASTAAHAALEGQATFAMLEWQLADRTGREVDLTELPDLRRLVGRAGLSEAAGMPALAQAPPLVRQSLLFPYVGGLAFVQEVWRKREGRPAPLGADLPASTEQVLHPDRYLGERDAPSEVRFADSLPGGWREVRADDLGEFEIRFLLTTFLADSARAAAAARGWDADRYRLARSGEDGDEVLVWVSVWDAPEDATEFAAAATDAFRSRYGDEAAVVGPEHADGPAGGEAAGGEGSVDTDAPRRVEVRMDEEDGRAVVIVLDRPSGLDAGSVALLAAHEVTGIP